MQVVGKSAIKWACGEGFYLTLQAPDWRIASLLLRMSFGVLWIAVLSGTVLLHGQNQPNRDDPISTDRPAVTASTVVVPKGSFQAENGFLVTDSQGQRSYDGPETSLRFGLANRSELRLSVPNYYWDVASGTSVTSGLSDLSIGMKRQLGLVSGAFDVSVIFFLSLPTGVNAVSSHGYDPGFQLPWSRKLSANWIASGQFALYWPTQADTRNLTGESAFLLDRQLTKPWDAYIEYAGDFPQRGGPRHLVDFGTAYKIAPQHQLDFRVGVGLSSAAVDHFIGIGYSFRFQAFGR